MRARRQSISCDQISDVAQAPSAAGDSGCGARSDGGSEPRLRIVFDEEASYVFGRSSEGSRHTTTIVTGAAAGCERSAWRDAFKKKKSYEMIDCRDESAARMLQLA